MLAKHSVIALLLIVVAACGKDDPEDKLAISNNTDSVVYIDMYAMKQAYHSQENQLVSGYIAPHSTYEILSSPLGETIYLDWYSNAGAMTNWMPDNMDENQTYTVIVHPKTKKRYDINNPGKPQGLRNILLNVNEKESKWKAVDALVKQGGNVQSVWTQVTDDERKTEIIFRKDFSMSFSNPAINETHAFIAEDRTTYRIIEIGGGWATMGNGAEPSGKWLGATMLMKDTLAFVKASDAQQRTFIFVRQ